MTKVRIDKFLFSIRIYKTRALASEACKNGRILVNNIPAKSSRDVSAGDTVSISFHGYKRIIRIITAIDKRVGAAIANTCFDDITPEEELLKKNLVNSPKQEFRPRGTGRPTKKERREIDMFKGEPDR